MLGIKTKDRKRKIEKRKKKAYENIDCRERILIPDLLTDGRINH